MMQSYQTINMLINTSSKEIELKLSITKSHAETMSLDHKILFLFYMYYCISGIKIRIVIKGLRLV